LATSYSLPGRTSASGASWPTKASLLTPSMPDFLFVAVLVWMFVSGEGGWVSLLADADTGWHIRTGEWILANGKVPLTDLFSYSKAGHPWFAWEWLTDVLYAILHGTLGLKGLLLFSAVILAGFGVILFRHMIWVGSNPFIALVLCLLTFGASSSHFLARPHVVTLLGFTVCLWLVEADRQRPSKRIWLLVPATALWVNLHGGFLGMIACLGLLAVGTLIEQFLARHESGLPLDYAPALRYALLAAACAGVTLLNPYGWELHLHVGSYLSSDWIKNNIQEFLAPRFRAESDRQFEVILFAGLMTVPWLVARRQIVPALWILFWAHNALTSVRHIALFAIVATPWAALFLTGVWNKAVAGAHRKSLPGILNQLAIDMSPACARSSLWVLVPLVLLLVLPDSRVGWPADFPKQKFPVEMAARHPDMLAQGRLLTQDQWADYLIYRFYPRQRVFIDGRSDFFGQKIGTDYIAATQGLPQWERILDSYNFDRILCPVKWPLYSLVRHHPRWKLVSEDGLAAFFVKTSTLPVPMAHPAAVIEKKAPPPI
jgi:hypothetical protein